LSKKIVEMQEVLIYSVPDVKKVYKLRLGKRVPLKRVMVKFAKHYGLSLSKLDFYTLKGMKLETYDTAYLLGPENLKVIFVKQN